MPFDNPVALGARGGRTAAANMTPEQRRERARKAAKSRVSATERIAELEARLARLEQLVAAA
jgi:hypothetical protein